ncbi:MAG: DUF4365 domain-containing protein [Saprospiraceae bacterium]|nr:DUF4365 domain-containing protein [Lewinella sp.]
MTEEQIKAHLSEHFVGAIAGGAGFKVIKPFEDHGVDLLVKRVKQVIFEGRIRWIDSSEMIALQLKSTTWKGVERRNGLIYYDLSVKNYNDLIFRKREMEGTNGGNIPLILVLLILPEKREEWLKIDAEKSFLQMGGTALWFYPSQVELYSSNRSTKRIIIPQDQTVDLNFFEEMFNLLVG